MRKFRSDRSHTIATSDRRMVGATFHLACRYLTQWRNFLEGGACTRKYAHLGARLYCTRISVNGRAFQSPKLLIRSSPHFHMAPLLTTPDILST
jgi:hypothetical protein